MRAFSRVRMSVSAARVTVGIDAAQGIVGAEFDDHRLGSLRHRPVEPVAAAGSGIAGHPGIDHVDLYPLVIQGLLQTRRECGGGRQAEAGAQRIAQHDHLDRPGPARRPAVWAKPAPAVIRARINTRMCANIRVKPLDRERGSAI